MKFLAAIMIAHLSPPKQLISKMIKPIKYSYCLNESNELIHISSVSKENRHSHIYHCLECGQPMVPRIGKIKVPHFAHKAENACDGESYLHKLAKRRIREKFMTSDILPLIFVRNVPCQNAGKPPFCQHFNCEEKDVHIPSDLKSWNGHTVYDTCQEEVRVGEFQSDLLLTCSTKPDREPVFIEVYKTHLSEEPKLSSDYRIIETTQIKSEADIDNIINNGFVEGQNCRTFNFNPKLPSIRKNDVPITRLALFNNGAIKILRNIDYAVYCDKIDKRIYPNSVMELNMICGMSIWPALVGENQIDPYQKGLVYLVKKGLAIKNCILCRFYKFNGYYNRHICILYKSLAISPKTKQTMANTCPRYVINKDLLTHPHSEFDDISEVPDR